MTALNSLFAAVAFLACVSANPSNFIADGQNAPQGLAPYHVHVWIRESVESQTRVGSGALISPRHVLTIAVNVRNFGWWGIGVGSHLRENLEWHESVEAYIHPHFEPNSQNNNIAIIVLPTPLTTTPVISPVQMPSLDISTFPLPNQIGRVTGFGSTDSSGGFANELKVAVQIVAEDETCIASFPNSTGFIENVFCGSADMGSVCGGDQGAALVQDVFFQTTLMGLAATWDATCAGGQPNLYIRVNSYRDWIVEITSLV